MIHLYGTKGKHLFVLIKQGDVYFIIRRLHDQSLVMIPKGIVDEYLKHYKKGDIDLYGPSRDCRDFFSNGKGLSSWDKYTHGQDAIITSLARHLLSLQKPIDISKDVEIENQIDIQKPYQHLIQGPPGTGKSYRINQDLKNLNAKSTRIVCHPESTNAQFIGNYRPQSQNGQITYAFSPGPFIKLLARALKDPNTPHILVIEELNRANSAAMFAEAFQLLDRDTIGWSEHPTDLGDDVLSYLRDELGEEHEEYVRARDEGVRLPPNFAIWATMNTADQGVFPMDTAFKRRWSFEHLGVDEGFETWRHDPWNPDLPTAGVPWQTFRVALNHALEQLEVEEDRLIGPFFLTERELQDPEANVVSKVLSYLRDDVLRYEPKGLFVGVNDKGEPDAEGRSPSFAWLKRLAQKKGLLKVFQGELADALKVAERRFEALMKEPTSSNSPSYDSQASSDNKRIQYEQNQNGEEVKEDVMTNPIPAP